MNQAVQQINSEDVFISFQDPTGRRYFRIPSNELESLIGKNKYASQFEYQKTRLIYGPIEGGVVIPVAPSPRKSQIENLIQSGQIDKYETYRVPPFMIFVKDTEI